jgi:hypothetical protein
MDKLLLSAEQRADKQREINKAQATCQELFPDQFTEEEKKSTLKRMERRAIWDSLEKMGHELANLKGIAQNPMPINKADFDFWLKQSADFITKLVELRRNVRLLVGQRIKYDLTEDNTEDLGEGC